MGVAKKMGRIIVAVCWFLTAALLCGTMLWFGGVFEKKLSPVERVVAKAEAERVAANETEVECVAAALLADSDGETVAADAVRHKIAETLISAKRYLGQDICVNFEKGLTTIPPGYTRPATPTYHGRWLMYVKTEFARSWSLAMVIARDAIRAGVTADSPTHYVRVPRGSWTEGAEAVAGVRAMRHVGTIGHTEFYRSPVADEKQKL